MNKEIKAFIDEEYESIYKGLNVNWLIGIRNKKQEISRKGLANSGIEQKMLTDYAIDLVNDINLKIKNLIEKSQDKFNFEMSKEDIENYIGKSIDNNIKYLERFNNELLEYFESKKMLFVESCIIEFSNAKANNKAELEKIKKELILINKSKNTKEKKENRKINKANIIGIIGIVVTIIGIIITIISII